MLFLTLFVAILVLYLYSLRAFDAPISSSVRSLLTFFRLLFLGVLLFLMTRPLIEEIRRTSVAPTLYIALDDSRSMSLPIQPRPDSPAPQPSRWETIRENLNGEGILRDWARDRFQLRFGLFSTLSQTDSDTGSWGAAFPQSATPDFLYTDIASVIGAFEKQASDRESSYLLLFTDGQSNRGKNPAAAAASLLRATGTDLSMLDKRIYSFGIGSTENLMDIIVDAVQLPATARAEEPLRLSAHVIGRGDLPAEPVTLQVQGQTREGTLVYSQQQTVTFTDQQTEASLVFDIPPQKEGEYQFTVEALPTQGELFRENNRQMKGIRIRSSKDRILILSSAPDWELKFLKRVLEDQQSIEVEAFLQHENGLSRLGDRTWVEQKAPGGTPTPTPEETPTNPSSLEELLADLPRYSVVILSNFLFDSDHLAFARQLKQYVEDGGSVIAVPGHLNATSLPPNIQEALPPILAAGFSPAQIQVMAQVPEDFLPANPEQKNRNFPPLFPYFRSRASSAAGQVLLRGQSSAAETLSLIELHRYGLGRILTLATNSFWRWQMLLGEGPFASFWLKVLYQSNPGLSDHRTQLYTNGFLYEVLEPIHVSYAVSGAVDDATVSGVSVRVQGPSGEETLWLTPSETRQGLMAADYRPAEAGDYVFADTVGSATAAVRVEANSVETYNIRQNVRDLREIARLTGGEYANSPAWKSVARNLPKATRHIEQSRIQFLGEKWWMAALLILFLGMEWFIRWRQGLP